jgi:hypothetical protein
VWDPELRHAGGFSPLPGLAERGAALVAVSPQKPDGSLTMQEKHELQFPVLSDPVGRCPDDVRYGRLLVRAPRNVTSCARRDEAAQLDLPHDLLL